MTTQDAVDQLVARAHRIGAAGLFDTEPIPSPCSSVCRMSGATPPLCEGCFRTLGEIAGWSRMGEADKRQVWVHIAQRIAETTA